MTDHLTDRQRAVSRLFLEGQGWGHGGSVDVEDRTDDHPADARILAPRRGSP